VVSVANRRVLPGLVMSVTIRLLRVVSVVLVLSSVSCTGSSRRPVSTSSLGKFGPCTSLTSDLVTVVSNKFWKCYRARAALTSDEIKQLQISDGQGVLIALPGQNLVLLQSTTERAVVDLGNSRLVIVASGRS
jgi:hypothetical protein